MARPSSRGAKEIEYVEPVSSRILTRHRPLPGGGGVVVVVVVCLLAVYLFLADPSCFFHVVHLDCMVSFILSCPVLPDFPVRRVPAYQLHPSSHQQHAPANLQDKPASQTSTLTMSLSRPQ
jgi:hypothetical protein